MLNNLCFIPMPRSCAWSCCYDHWLSESDAHVKSTEVIGSDQIANDECRPTVSANSNQIRQLPSVHSIDQII